MHSYSFSLGEKHLMKCFPRYCRVGLFSCLSFILSAVVFAEELKPTDWPQWRGPTRDGRVVGTQWPDSLDETHLELSWEVEQGPSYSGPIVAGNRVFTTETDEKKTEVVYAYDKTTGEELWRTEWEGAMTVPLFAASNGSWIRATPACDGETLFVAGMRDVLYALDCATGDTKWHVDFKQRFDSPMPAFGFASSPLVHGDALFVQAGGGFIKLNKTNGETIWRVANDGGGMFGSAFSSPIMTTLQNKKILLVQTRKSLKGVDPLTGDEMWSQNIEAFRGMNILTPTVHNETIFTSAHSGHSQLWKHTDENTSLEEIWSGKSQAYMSSPVVVANHIFLHLRNQRIVCIHLETGEETWRTTPFGKYQSMAVLNDKILVLDESGELLLISADPNKFNLIDRRRVAENNTWGHIAISKNQIFIRRLNSLAAYNWE